MNHVDQIARETGCRPEQVTTVAALFDDGGTIPFIARYRKDRTGNLSETDLEAIQARISYYKDLEARKATILKSIDSQEKLTPELKAQIDACLDAQELEDLYLPYKPRRVTKAQKARERGLQPVADWIIQREPTPSPVDKALIPFVDAEKDVPTVDEVLKGARDIVAEEISTLPELRKQLLKEAGETGIVVSKVTKDWLDKPSKFEDYADFQEPCRKIPGHRLLALRRGEADGVLATKIQVDEDSFQARIERFLRPDRGHPLFGELQAAIHDAWRRLLWPSLEARLFKDLFQVADDEAIERFRGNTQQLLLASPAGPKWVLGIDPGLRTGCKCAVIDPSGKFMGHETIFLTGSAAQEASARKTIESLVKTHSIDLIAVGNGTGGRETEAFVREVLRDATLSATVVMVSEAGASIYSASEVAREEFPHLDLTIRGAISIARRLQDPLAELVKIDPKSIGVGQYQHDVDQSALRDALTRTVESCVNRVGVDVNTASKELLGYVAGINKRLAASIVAFRDQSRRIVSREQLREVGYMGEKAFEQAAGFLRIREGSNVLDASAVHPESYTVVQALAESASLSLPELIGNKAAIRKLKRQADSFVQHAPDVGKVTLKDILDELSQPGRDPRQAFKTASLRDDITSIEHLKPGLKLEGTVTNITSFGAFVDVGVKQDGLVHISKLSKEFVSDPRDIVKIGQVVTVTVQSVEVGRSRIALSMVD